jgi:hypothetical protein
MLSTSYTITLDYFREDLPPDVVETIEKADNKEFIAYLIKELEVIDPYDYDKIIRCIISYGGLFLLKGHSNSPYPTK